jgi:hypothetical protein
MEPSSPLQSAWNFFYKKNIEKHGSSFVYKIPIQGHTLYKVENLLHMQLVISLSFVKLLWPFVRYISYSHDQDHVHTAYAC